MGRSLLHSTAVGNRRCTRQLRLCGYYIAKGGPNALLAKALGLPDLTDTLSLNPKGVQDEQIQNGVGVGVPSKTRRSGT